jgi:bacteriocin biosynthesis cyclodehydratase domain-containing protein
MTQGVVPRRPLLAPWYRLVGEGDRLLLAHGESLIVLEGGAVGTLLPALLPLLDGRRSLDDLAARLGPVVRPAIEQAVATLAEHGAVVEGPDAPAELRAQALAVAGAWGLPPAEAAERLQAASVEVVGAAAAGIEVARLLRSAGIDHVRPGSWRCRGRVELAVVAPAADELDRLPRWNAAALARGRRWLLLRPFDGHAATVGPLVVPGESACHECLLRRLGANLGLGSDIFEVETAPAAAVPDTPTEALLVALAAQIALRWLVGRDTTLPGRLHVLAARRRVDISEHHVLRVPRCAACSSVGWLPAPLPWHAAELAAA